jgi:hypothetical protein
VARVLRGEANRKLTTAEDLSSVIAAGDPRTAPGPEGCKRKKLWEYHLGTAPGFGFMWFEATVFALGILLAFWLWTGRRRRWNPNAQQPGERWTLIDLREYPQGWIHLLRSENDGHWIVRMVPADERVKSTLSRYASEGEAREAFAVATLRAAQTP